MSMLIVHIRHDHLTTISWTDLYHLFNLRQCLFDHLKIVYYQFHTLKELLALIETSGLKTNTVVTLSVPCNADGDRREYQFYGDHLSTSGSDSCLPMISDRLKRSKAKLPKTKPTKKSEPITTLLRKKLTTKTRKVSTTSETTATSTSFELTSFYTEVSETNSTLSITTMMATTIEDTTSAFETSSSMFPSTSTMTTSTTTLILTTKAQTTSTIVLTTTIETNFVPITTTILMENSTSSSSRTSFVSSSLTVYFLLGFSFLVLIIIIASTWQCFRQAFHAQQEEEENANVNQTYKPIQTDRYGMTNKDGGSNGSWSRGSPLLLSPTLK